ncbi:MFS transporter [Segeticoccus rhizosphaerae]|uniref:MFS transporter n=1 Tax=Segeticoccus rhizosphaerae TaxID=1104777 RepID=UPI0010BFEF26|nr:MFS transporter [Ornithinicoccus soli]
MTAVTPMPSPPPGAGAITRAGRREWIALTALMLPLLLVSMDVSVLYFAVPFISETLEPTSTQQLWIFDVYGFVLAGLLVTMGSLGDRIGRRRLLLIGATAFGLASVAAAYAPSAEALILARAVLGVAGATLMPSTLALLRNLFHDPGQRARAIAIWTAVTSAGVAVGPILSGILLEHFWWGSVFLVNTPVMVMLLVVAPFLIPEFRDRAAGRFDLLSSLLSLAAVLPAIYGVKQLAAHGFAVWPVVSLLCGLVVAGLFVRRQHAATHPMFDLRIFRSPGVSGSLVANLTAMFALVGFAIFTTQYLQSVLGMSPLRAALWSVVPSLAVAGAAPVAVQLGARVGRPRVMSGGFAVAAGAFVVLSRARADSGLVVVLVGAGLLAVGLVAVLTLVTDTVVGAVEPEKAGAVSALMETASEFGGALGMAVLGSIGAAVYRTQMGDALPAGLPPGAADEATQTLAGATVTAAHLPGGAGDTVLAVARDAFTQGMSAAALAGVLLMAAAAVLLPRLLRGVGHVVR